MGESMEGTSNREQVQDLGHRAQAKLLSRAESLRGSASRRIHSFADALDDLSNGDGREELAPVARTAGRWAHRAGDLLDRRSANELFDRARGLVRERPGLTLLGLAAVGLLGARLIKD